jgi:hypothetical protein
MRQSQPEQGEQGDGKRSIARLAGPIPEAGDFPLVRRQPLLGLAKGQPFERVGVVEEVGGRHQLVVAVTCEVQA